MPFFTWAGSLLLFHVEAMTSGRVMFVAGHSILPFEEILLIIHVEVAISGSITCILGEIHGAFAWSLWSVGFV